jgi:hypothetical protein
MRSRGNSGGNFLEGSNFEVICETDHALTPLHNPVDAVWPPRSLAGTPFQVATDMSTSKQAAQQGLTVVRISHSDMPNQMQVLDAAWKTCMAGGTVYVNPCRNTDC